MKFVINKQWKGIFDLSKLAVEEYSKAKGKTIILREKEYETEYYVLEGDKEKPFYPEMIERHDTTLVEIVEKLGDKANRPGTKLKVVEVPDGNLYMIKRHTDGSEYIAEYHRTWE